MIAPSAAQAQDPGDGKRAARGARLPGAAPGGVV
jgi:hypothetical protein